MSESASTEKEVAAVGGRTRWARYAVLGAVCALVIGIYAWSANPGLPESLGSGAQNSYYNLLVQGFRNGQLNLKIKAPPGIDEIARYGSWLEKYAWLENHGVYDLSYYKGKLYLYFGVTPALVLFWPCVALSGHYVSHKDAVVIFTSVGFLAGAGLLCSVKRRYFKDTGFAAVWAGTLALGLANFAPAMLTRSDVYEVAIACGYALTMLALAAIWQALHEPQRRGRWLAAASLAYGLAVGARPSLLFGAVILLIPVVAAWREKRPVRLPLLAATAPIALIVMGLLIYNALRFDSPMEFGQRYQLPQLPRTEGTQQFSPHYFWFDFQVSFLKPANWSTRFPMVQNITPPPFPKGANPDEHAFGVLTNIPLVWLALAVPLAWRGRPGDDRFNLRWFLAAVALLFGICALTLCLHDSMALRYEMEFVSPLLLLAVMGILVLERALACQPIWRRAVCGGWSLLAAFSLVFNLLVGLQRQVVAHNELGDFLFQAGKADEAIAQYQATLRIKPDDETAHNNLGNAFLQKGRVDDAITQYQKAVQLESNSAPAHSNLGNAFLQKGRVDEAIAHLQQAVQIATNSALAYNNLGNALLHKGMVDEATALFQKAIQLKPDYTEAYNNLGTALLQKGRVNEAIAHFQMALQIKPADPRIQSTLAWILATCPQSSLRNGGKAVELARQANGLTGGENPVVLHILAAAYAEAGRYSEAVETAQHALRLAGAQSNAVLAGALESELKLYQAGSPFHSPEQSQ